METGGKTDRANIHTQIRKKDKYIEKEGVARVCVCSIFHMAGELSSQRNAGRQQVGCSPKKTLSEAIRQFELENSGRHFSRKSRGVVQSSGLIREVSVTPEKAARQTHVVDATESENMNPKPQKTQNTFLSQATAWVTGMVGGSKVGDGKQTGETEVPSPSPRCVAPARQNKSRAIRDTLVKDSENATKTPIHAVVTERGASENTNVHAKAMSSREADDTNSPSTSQKSTSYARDFEIQQLKTKEYTEAVMEAQRAENGEDVGADYDSDGTEDFHISNGCDGGNADAEEEDGDESGDDDGEEEGFELDEEEQPEPEPVKRKKRLKKDSDWEDECKVCGQGDANGDHPLLCCRNCPNVYHCDCLKPPIPVVPREDLLCPMCTYASEYLQEELDRFVSVRHVRKTSDEVRTSQSDHNDRSQSQRQNPEQTQNAVNTAKNGETLKNPSSTRTEYLVKWRKKSLIHCSWIPEQVILDAVAWYPQSLGVKFRKIQKSDDKSPIEVVIDEYENDLLKHIEDEDVTIDRIFAQRKKENGSQYLVKWQQLGYDEATWEDDTRLPYILNGPDALNQFLDRFQYQRVKCRKTEIDRTLAKGETPAFLKGGTLHQYQVEGSKWLRHSWRQGKSVILGDEMGLGKTIQAISFIASLYAEGCGEPHLIIAPLSTLQNWQRELSRWMPELNVVTYVGNQESRKMLRRYEMKIDRKAAMKNGSGKAKALPINQQLPHFDIVLTSFDFATKDVAVLRRHEWATLTIDEGHRLKSQDSKLYNALLTLRVRQKVILTGTPLQNALEELYMLLHFLDSETFDSVDEFKEKFSDLSTGDKVDKLHEMIGPYFLRRMKKDVQKQLPPKYETLVRCELSAKQKTIYKNILTRNYEALTSTRGKLTPLNNMMMQLRKVCCHSELFEDPNRMVNITLAQRLEDLLLGSGKLAMLDRMLEQLHKGGHRVLIYSQFVIVLNILEEYCKVRQWGCERIDGTVSGGARQEAIDRYNAPDSKSFVFLLSTRAGGMGINLATADTVVMFDSDWNPHNDLQAYARAHRIGQTRTVMIYHLVCRATVEEKMIQTAKDKRVLEKIVVGSNNNNRMNQSELDIILRYGADELFAEGDDAKKSAIYYDDDAVAKLLDRSRIENDKSDEEETDKLLSRFKVADYGTKEEEEEEKENEIKKEDNIDSDPDAQAAEGGSAERSRPDDYWSKLLGKAVVDMREKAEAEFGKGKRRRKTVLSHNFTEETSPGLNETTVVKDDDKRDKDYVFVDSRKKKGAAKGSGRENSLGRTPNGGYSPPLNQEDNGQRQTNVGQEQSDVPMIDNDIAAMRDWVRSFDIYNGVPEWVIQDKTCEIPFCYDEFYIFLSLVARFGADLNLERKEPSKIILDQFLKHFPARNVHDIDNFCKSFIYRIMMTTRMGTIGSQFCMTEGMIIKRITFLHNIKKKLEEIHETMLERRDRGDPLYAEVTTATLWKNPQAHGLYGESAGFLWDAFCDYRFMQAMVKHGKARGMYLISLR